ncbi:hypothetical protein GOODEAATRI_011385 [Goodea atripinnis]|uniref:EGF-like domain-containing protein n=1 Tax=Goodea atripinnis TaxID=208336 RepID=A0ABV0PMP6_9TELE
MLTVFPERYLYWSDWGDNPHIGRIGMDGTNRSVIIKDKITWPNGLALDFINDRIYWADAREDYIAFTSMDGTNRHTVVGHPCQINNGGCSNLCLLSPGGGYKCACPTNFYLASDGKQCLSNCTASQPDRSCLCTDERTCEPYQFRCKNNRCVPGRWQCDYDNDCGDNSDEEKCVPRKCSESEFACTNGRCIAGRWKCDGDHDCADGSDEVSLKHFPSFFSLDCLKSRRVLKNCNTLHLLQDGCDVKCDSDQFQCKNGHCIPIRWRCDSDVDCMDGSDEEKCDSSGERITDFLLPTGLHVRVER